MWTPNNDNTSAKGVYPKDFVFKGWHPQCRCFVVPILAQEDEFVEMQKALLNGEEPPQPSGKIEEPNEYFNKWVEKNQSRIESAGTLPYWVKDNKKAVEKAITSAEDGGKEDGTPKRPKKVEPSATDKIKETESRYAANRKEYERLLADENYKDVAFNEENGGLKATHVGHNFDYLRGNYEKTVQEVGYKSWHSIIFGAEPQNMYRKRSTEGLWDNLFFEIGSAENNTPNNVRNALKHCAKKPNCDVAVIFFPKNYSKGVFEEGFGKFRGLSGTVQFRSFKKIICIYNGEIVNEINQP